MGRKKQSLSRVVHIRPEEMVLKCEWMECKASYTDMDEFRRHVKEHLIQYLVDHDQNQDKPGSFSCRWRECITEIEGENSDYMRHVYFHTFHVKIKCIGALLIEKTGRKGCTFGSQCRNLIPELPERLECGWESCHKLYDNAELFYRHVENHIGVYPEGNNVENGCACQWDGCKTKTKSRYKLREHLRSHTQEKLVACPTCGNLFANRTKYFDHVTRQMEVYTGKRYQCSHCNRTFPTERILRDHMRNHVNQYKCLYCDMTLPSPSSLRKHMRYKHSNDKPHQCEKCTYRCKSQIDLKRHMETHNTGKQYVCGEKDCTYATKCYGTFASHVKHVHQSTGPKYQCHVCSARFSRGAHLTRHLKAAHKFSWPSGHSRFRYRMHEDGTMRLQTVRYETVDLAPHPDVLPDQHSETVPDQQQSPNKAVGTHVNTEGAEQEMDVKSGTATPGDVHAETHANLEEFDALDNEMAGHLTNSDNVETGTYVMHDQLDNMNNALSENIPATSIIQRKTLTMKSDQVGKMDATVTDTNEKLIGESKENMETEEAAGVDPNLSMVQLSITKTTDGKFLLKTAGCAMEEPMTIMMSDYSSEELQGNMYNLQMLGDVALQNKAL